MTVTAKAGRASLTLTRSEGVTSISVAAGGASLGMYAEVDRGAKAAVQNMAGDLRGMLAKLSPWSSSHATGGRWTLTAEAFPHAVTWAVHWADRMRGVTVAVAFGAIPTGSVVHKHGQRHAVEYVPEIHDGRKAAVAACAAWIDAAEAALLRAVRGLS